MALSQFRSHLTNRLQRCRVNGEFSSSFPMKTRFLQSSIIGPLLFLVYINDLPNCLNEVLPRIFADDTNISFTGNFHTGLENRMNVDLHSLNQWLTVIKLSLNIAKTEFMIIGSRQ